MCVYTSEDCVFQWLQKVREVLGEGRLTADDTTGCLQPASTADNHSLPKPTATGDAPVSPFADYLHSQHDPVSVAPLHISVVHT